MGRAIKVLSWMVVAAYTAVAAGFVMMAIDGYDFWDPLFPPMDSLAETGYDLATLAQLGALLLMTATWIVLSIFVVRLRDQIPTTWKHSKAAVWLWWFVPVAWFWMPREVFLEVAGSAAPGNPVAVKRWVDRWWLSAVGFLVAIQLGYIGAGPWFLAGAAILVAVTSGVAAYFLVRLLTAIGSPEITFADAPDHGEQPIPMAVESPTVPGWYNDPSGQSSHQAYWDGGRYTGAVRPDPRVFPTHAQPGKKQRDPLRTWLIVFGIVFTVASMGYSIVRVFIEIEEEGGFDIVAHLGLW